jgi:hypothetical protein
VRGDERVRTYRGSPQGSVGRAERVGPADDERFEQEEPDEDEQALRIVNADGLPIVFVNVYDVTRHYGGPEEGGWWYDAGEPILSIVCTSREQAEQVRDKTRAGKYARTRARYSVLGGQDYDVCIEEHIGEAFPKERPRYA